MDLERKTYKVVEAAKVLGLSVPKMYAVARTKDFPAMFIGGRILIPIDKFMQWMERQTNRSNAEPHSENN